MLQMQADVADLVQQSEPEVVEPVVSKRHGQYWSNVLVMQGDAVHGHTGQSAFYNNVDANRAYRIQSAFRAIIQGA